MSSGPDPADLGDGLELRAATPDDVDAIVELQIAAFGASDEPGVRAHLWGDAVGDWTVVTEDSRIVSASALISHRFALDGLAFPGGQIEYVVTAPGHQRRGLVRTQFAWHHRRAAELGHLALLIGGIPYLYRRFGYGYGLDYPAVRAPEPIDRDAGATAGLVVRPAVDADRPAVEELDRHRPSSGLRMVRDADAWDVTWAICHDNDWERLWVVERPAERSADGASRLVAWFRTQAKPEDGRVYLPAAGLAPGEPAATTLAIVAHARAVAGEDALVVWDVAGTSFGTHLDELPEVGPVFQHGHGIYARVPDPVALLDHLRPVLTERFGASRYAARDGELVLSLYGSGVALDLRDGTVAAVRSVPGVEDPFGANGVGIAPDWFGALVLGRWGASGLEARADDVTLGRAKGLMDVLFPIRPSDVVAEL